MFSYRVNDYLELRLLQLADTDELFALTDTHRNYLRVWMPWLDSVQSPADTRSFILSSLQQLADNNGPVTAICENGNIAGIIGFNRSDHANRIGTIGYWLAESYTGRGLMTAACRALISYGFQSLGLNRIVIAAATENHRSRAIPERLGFVHEGTLRDGEWLYDHYVDLEVYGYLHRDWQT